MTYGHNETVDCYFGLCWQCDKKQECACDCHKAQAERNKLPAVYASTSSMMGDHFRGRRSKASYGINGEYREKVNGGRRTFY